LLNINQSNAWCGYCSNPRKKLCDNIKCKMCFTNSFASHIKSCFWSDENELTPRQVFNCADRKNYIFNCNKCEHKLYLNLKNISSKSHWCSYCSHQKLCENNDCEMCFNNSFASVERCIFLNDKSINPRMLFKSTNKKFNFDCSICNNIFKTPLSDITRGIWCPFCVNKTERILFDKLKEIYFTLKRQLSVDRCKNIKTNRYLPFDFAINERKIIIELDGKQHFEQISNWMSPEITHQNDLYKMKCANENGFSMIRILQKDVYYNKYDWIKELTDNIEIISIDNRVQNIYMCKKNEYKDFDI